LRRIEIGQESWKEIQKQGIQPERPNSPPIRDRDEQEEKDKEKDKDKDKNKNSDIIPVVPDSDDSLHLFERDPLESPSNFSIPSTTSLPEENGKGSPEWETEEALFNETESEGRKKNSQQNKRKNKKRDISVGHGFDHTLQTKELQTDLDCDDVDDDLDNHLVENIQANVCASVESEV